MKIADSTNKLMEKTNVKVGINVQEGDMLANTKPRRSRRVYTPSDVVEKYHREHPDMVDTDDSPLLMSALPTSGSRMNEKLADDEKQ